MADVDKKVEAKTCSESYISCSFSSSDEEKKPYDVLHQNCHTISL